MLSILSTGSLTLVKENERHKKDMRESERRYEDLHKTILATARSRFERMIDFFLRRDSLVVLAFRDTAFQHWRNLAKRPTQRESVRNVMLRSFATPVRRVLVAWAQETRKVRGDEYRQMHGEHSFNLNRIKELEEALRDALQDCDGLKKQVHFLLEERAESIAQIERNDGTISGLQHTLHHERRKSTLTMDASVEWESKYNEQFEENEELRAENEKLMADLAKHRTITQQRKESVQTRTLKMLGQSTTVLLKDAFQTWNMQTRRNLSPLIKPMERYAKKIVELEKQMVETKRMSQHLEQNLKETREQNRHLNKENEQLGQDLYDFVEGKGVRHFFRCFDLPRIILSMFRRLVVLGQQAQTPSLGNIDNENALIREAIARDMCTHRRNKVSTKHEFQLYVERLYLTDVPPTHVSQVLCLLLGLDFVSPITATAMQKRMSYTTPDLTKLTHAWRYTWDNQVDRTQIEKQLLAFRPSVRQSAIAQDEEEDEEDTQEQQAELRYETPPQQSKKRPSNVNSSRKSASISNDCTRNSSNVENRNTTQFNAEKRNTIQFLN